MNREEMQSYLKSKAYDGPNARDFFEDLLELFELSGSDPVVKKMYSLAWENGHAYGYTEVFSHFDDLVGVFKTND